MSWEVERESCRNEMVTNLPYKVDMESEKLRNAITYTLEDPSWISEAGVVVIDKLKISALAAVLHAMRPHEDETQAGFKGGSAWMRLDAVTQANQVSLRVLDLAMGDPESLTLPLKEDTFH